MRVTLANGQPVRGASVSCTPEGHSYWRKDSTDALGVIVFEAMEKLTYIVDVDIPSDHDLLKEGYQRSRWVRVPPRTETTEVHVVLGKAPSTKPK